MPEEYVFEHTLDAPADEVWALMRRFREADLPSGLAESIEWEGEGVGALRKIVWATGDSVTHELETRDDERRRMRVRSRGPTGLDSEGDWTDLTVEESDAGGCKLTWRHVYVPSTDPGAARTILRDYFLLVAQSIEERLKAG